nr:MULTISPECIES: putative lipid II flippase FtsW [unclassified Mycobacterium]
MPRPLSRLRRRGKKADATVDSPAPTPAEAPAEAGEADAADPVPDPSAGSSHEAVAVDGVPETVAESVDIDAAAETDEPETDAMQTTPDAAAPRPAKAPPTATAPDGAKGAKGAQQDSHSRFGTWLSRPMTSFHLIIAVAGLLTTLGLIMVLSASGVRSYDNDGSAWVIFGKQVLWTVIGLVACYVSLRMSVRFLRRIAFTGYVVTVILLVLVLVPGIGNLANGSRKWFVIAGFSMQPSELAKIAFAIWGAHLLATRRLERATLREMLIPLVPAAVIALALIVAQPDLGQTVSLGIILLALLWYAGLPLRVFGTSLLAVFVAGAILAMSAGYRSDRVKSWLDPENDPMDTGYQARQAKFALAHGGVFGDGLGQGVAKWNYLPNAHNDFIFAIIGEELGFIGAFGLLVLFGLFAYTGMRIARRSADPFLRLLTATTTMWVLGQAFINIGYVIGILPVTGIQLPLISAGGTSTAATLFMIGIMINAARHEPEAVAALRAGRDDKVNRLLRLPLPEPYLPSRVDALRDRKRPRPQAGRAAPTRAKGGAAPAKPRKGGRTPDAALPPALPRKPVRPARAPAGARARVRAHGARTGEHHGSGQRYANLGAGLRTGEGAGQRQPRRTRALEGQRYG